MGEQLDITSIISVDLSDFGGPVLNGAVDSNEIIIKVWKWRYKKWAIAKNIRYTTLGVFGEDFTEKRQLSIPTHEEGCLSIPTHEEL